MPLESSYVASRGFILFGSRYSRCKRRFTYATFGPFGISLFYRILLLPFFKKREKEKEKEERKEKQRKQKKHSFQCSTSITSLSYGRKRSRKRTLTAYYISRTTERIPLILIRDSYEVGFASFCLGPYRRNVSCIGHIDLVKNCID